MGCTQTGFALRSFRDGQIVLGARGTQVRFQRLLMPLELGQQLSQLLSRQLGSRKLLRIGARRLSRGIQKPRFPLVRRLVQLDQLPTANIQ